MGFDVGNPTVNLVKKNKRYVKQRNNLVKMVVGRTFPISLEQIMEFQGKALTGRFYGRLMSERILND